MKIAACAICKNEEKNIPRWLEHTANFDYRVVIDTGSTDNSVHLLKSAGVFIVEKKIEPFRFDTARNSVFEFVPPDADWLVWPDFDEYYNKNWRFELERAVKTYPWITRVTYKTFQYIGGKMVEGAESGTVMESKIHRHNMYQWKKPVHEHLIWVGEGSEAVKRVSGIARFHMHIPSNERNRHYFEIAKRALEENPNDEYLTWFVLKEYYYALKDMKESKKYAKRYLDMTRGNTDFRVIARSILESNKNQISTDSDIKTSTFVFPGNDYTFGIPSPEYQPLGSISSPSNLARQKENTTGDSRFPQAIMRNMIFDLFKNKEDKAGIELARVYLAYNPSDIPVVNELAGALYKNKRFEEALILSEQLARRFPNDLGIAFNLAKCYHALKRPDDARKLLALLLEKDPHNRDYQLDYALYLSGEGKFDESEKILRMLTPDARVNFNLGWYEMRKGRFIKGFELRDDGRKEHLWGSEHMTDLPKHKRYKGEPLKGKTVLLFSEGGLGDEMIFSRFAPILKERKARHILFGCSPQLVKIFERAFKGVVDEILPMSEAKQRSYDYYIPMMNAPNLLNIETPQVTFPYLKPDLERVAFWKEKLNTIAQGKLKIGIRWAGNPKFEHEQFREIDPVLFTELNKYGQLFSLQRDDGAEKLPHNYGIYDLQHDLKDWDETLAVLSNLDILVSSCTSIVHAAGAVGTKTCVIVPISPYFTWAIPETQSSWYPSVTIFRQEKLRSWKEPFQKLHEHLSRILLNQ